MNVCSLFLSKNKQMKTTMLIKFCLILPVLLLVDYITMVLLGCASCLFGFGADYYRNTLLCNR